MTKAEAGRRSSAGISGAEEAGNQAKARRERSRHPLATRRCSESNPGLIQNISRRQGDVLNQTRVCAREVAKCEHALTVVVDGIATAEHGLAAATEDGL